MIVCSFCFRLILKGQLGRVFLLCVFHNENRKWKCLTCLASHATPHMWAENGVDDLQQFGLWIWYSRLPRAKIFRQIICPTLFRALVWTALMCLSVCPLDAFKELCEDSTEPGGKIRGGIWLFVLVFQGSRYYALYMYTFVFRTKTAMLLIHNFLVSNAFGGNIIYPAYHEQCFVWFPKYCFQVYSKVYFLQEPFPSPVFLQLNFVYQRT